MALHCTCLVLYALWVALHCTCLVLYGLWVALHLPVCQPCVVSGAMHGAALHENRHTHTCLKHGMEDTQEEEHGEMRSCGPTTHHHPHTQLHPPIATHCIPSSPPSPSTHLPLPPFLPSLLSSPLLLAGQCRSMPSRMATRQELLAVHTPQHLDHLQAACAAAAGGGGAAAAGVYLPSDTYVNPHTAMCASLAAGSAAEVAAVVARGDAPCGAAIIRPPGHHAESNTVMGFCFYCNAAVAARAAQEAGAQRVLILDWDVHHGNGTQHIFEHDPSVLYMSLHRYDG
jgi:hypothetical protein